MTKASGRPIENRAEGAQPLAEIHVLEPGGKESFVEAADPLEGVAANRQGRGRRLFDREGLLSILLGIALAAAAGIVREKVVDQEKVPGVRGEGGQPAQLEGSLVFPIRRREFLSASWPFLQIEQPGRDGNSLGVFGESAADLRERITLGARVGIQEEQDVSGRGPRPLVGCGRETPIGRIGDESRIRTDRLDSAAAREPASVVHDHDGNARTGAGDPRSRADDTFDRFLDLLRVFPGDDDRGNFADSGRCFPASPRTTLRSRASLRSTSPRVPASPRRELQLVEEPPPLAGHSVSGVSPS